VTLNFTQMHFRNVSVIVFMLGLLMAACHKEDSSNNASGDSATVIGGELSTPPDFMGRVDVASQTQAAADALSKQDYESTVGNLIQAKLSYDQMTEAQKLKYDQQVQDTTIKLMEAAQRDAKAAEAYQNFGRLMTGR
jgi:hypothetical protein